MPAWVIVFSVLRGDASCGELGFHFERTIVDPLVSMVVASG